MTKIAAYLTVLFVGFLVGANAGQLLTADKCPDDPSIPCILFPPAKNQVYNYIDKIIVTYTSPWARGVNLSLNCWPSETDADRSRNFVHLVKDDLFCSQCAFQLRSFLGSESVSDAGLGAGNGSHKFENLNVALNGSVTYPTRCWVALGPYEADDLPGDPYLTSTGSEAMTAVITGGNFTLAMKRRKPVITREIRPPVWTGLSAGMQLGIIAGLSLILLGSLVATVMIAVRKGRLLEDPMNPAYQGLFVAERNVGVSYRALDGRAPDADWARNAQAKELLEAGGSSSYPLLGGSSGRRY
ncbi:hypothetical protein A1O7_07251 [Cladophialophora yegresii CBS 114405]|uniref:Autophagy-related protein 27 n=1 Tax=Cladophialophora yegresii CBS 114405 TaxID=1182544 RepID=W9VMK0_9EURO|nr:uncharacterized protein A1O7_07251 [Cladophialophora yegresii CBS 114405]EXJ56907.1 hypothetical protein A1O7_07251 [Cladophialophora yegresii CBS 114405]